MKYNTVTITFRSLRPRNNRLFTLRKELPALWAQRVVQALISHDGFVSDAAAHLGVHERTLYRWLSDPAIYRALVRSGWLNDAA